MIGIVSGQLPTRTIPRHVDIGPDKGFYSLVIIGPVRVSLVGSFPSGGVALGIVVLVGNYRWALFYIRWGVVLHPI